MTPEELIEALKALARDQVYHVGRVAAAALDHIRLLGHEITLLERMLEADK
jgi:hypothetical protein